MTLLVSSSIVSTMQIREGWPDLTKRWQTSMPQKRTYQKRQLKLVSSISRSVSSEIDTTIMHTVLCVCSL